MYPYRIAERDSSPEERREIHAFNKCVVGLGLRAPVPEGAVQSLQSTPPPPLPLPLLLPHPPRARLQKAKCRELQNVFTHPGAPGAAFIGVVDKMRAALQVTLPPTPDGPGGKPWFPHGVRLLSPAYFEVLRWIAR
jgi:hypothetical protein